MITNRIGLKATRATSRVLGPAGVMTDERSTSVALKNGVQVWGMIERRQSSPNERELLEKLLTGGAWWHCSEYELGEPGRQEPWA